MSQAEKHPFLATLLNQTPTKNMKKLRFFFKEKKYHSKESNLFLAFYFGRVCINANICNNYVEENCFAIMVIHES